MPQTLEDKKAIVSEVAAVAANAQSAIAAEYRGLPVGVMTHMRARARNDGVYLRVVKNTLARRAVEGTDFACMQAGLVGPMILAFSRTEPAAAARLLKDYAKDHKDLKIKLIALNGQLLDGAELDRLASLPSRDEALSQLMAVMKAPVEKLARTLAEPHAKLTRTLAALRDSRQGDGQGDE